MYSEDNKVLSKSKMMKRVPSKNSTGSVTNTAEHMFKRRQATLLSLASAAQISHRSNITTDPHTSTANTKMTMQKSDQTQVSSFIVSSAKQAEIEENRYAAPV